MSAFPSAAGLYPRFRSRIDAWLGGVILLGILVCAALAIGLRLQKGIHSTGTLVISPSNQVDFIRALKARNAAVELEPVEDVACGT